MSDKIDLESYNETTVDDIELEIQRENDDVRYIQDIASLRMKLVLASPAIALTMADLSVDLSKYGFYVGIIAICYILFLSLGEAMHTLNREELYEKIETSLRDFGMDININTINEFFDHPHSIALIYGCLNLFYLGLLQILYGSITEIGFHSVPALIIVINILFTRLFLIEKFDPTAVKAIGGLIGYAFDIIDDTSNLSDEEKIGILTEVKNQGGLSESEFSKSGEKVVTFDFDSKELDVVKNEKQVVSED